MELHSEISAAGHGPAAALDIPEIGCAEGPWFYNGKGFFYHAGQVGYILFGKKKAEPVFWLLFHDYTFIIFLNGFRLLWLRMSGL